MQKIKISFLVLFLTIASGLCHAQLPDSLKAYVRECIQTMQKQSLYASHLNWKDINNSVEKQMQSATTIKDAEAIVISVFKQLKDLHAVYNGIDTTYRYQSGKPGRIFSPGLLAEYKKARSVKTALLPGNIAYYKMPAILIGSNREKMKLWANTLTDSICKLEAQQPAAYIIDLRMNNGGNSEPMWNAIKNLVGEKNRSYTAGADKKILADETDTLTLNYKAAGIPDRPCAFRKNIPVAVLIGPGTASSGEITALSFTTRKKTRLFGEPTIGVANVTNGFIIQNKGYLLLTVGYIANADKKIVAKFVVNPEVYVAADDNYANLEKDKTVQAAMKWLKGQVR